MECSTDCYDEITVTLTEDDVVSLIPVSFITEISKLLDNAEILIEEMDM